MRRWLKEPRSRIALLAGAALAAFALFRVWYASIRQLAPDEAYYWVWSRHLAAGYLDHPPMVAYLIRLSTLLLGNTELAVRLPAVLLSVGTIGILIALAWRLIGDARAVLFVAVILLSSPLMSVTATIMTPDTPAMFFSTCALACAVGLSVSAPHAGRWILFGMFTGLAMLSKYTTVLLPLAVGLAMFTCPQGRAHLRRPWMWLAMIVAMGVFSPVIHWNATHQWASFRFQLGHGMGAGETSGLGNLIEYLSGQALVWTPLLFGLSIVVLVHYWRGFASRPMAHRILLCSATATLAFFAIASLRHRGEPNWPGFAYLPLTLLIGMYLTANWQGSRVRWARAGINVALVMTVFLHVPELLWLVQRPVICKTKQHSHWTLQWEPLGSSKLDDLFGWREMGQAVEAHRRGAVVVCGNYRDASETAFYLPGQPDVWSLSSPGDRLSGFDFFPNPPDLATMPRVLFLGKSVHPLVESFPHHQTTVWTAVVKGRRLRNRLLTLTSREPAWVDNREDH